MINSGLPAKQGLYDPQFEHDACGIGFVVNIKGVRSNSILKQALEVLVNLSHRGGLGSEPETGDGAGVLMQLPHAFYKKACLQQGVSLPEAGSYGTGLVFLPQDAAERLRCENIFDKIVSEEGQKVLLWRDVPVNPEGLGKTAFSCMPFMRQVFVARGEQTAAGDAFERKLYVIRRRAENAIRYAEGGCPTFYLPSFSSRTVVYKGMLTAEQLGSFYTDLSDESIEIALCMVHSRYSTNTFPSWERAHPNRYLIHNGEINTLRGNINRMRAREGVLTSKLFGGDLKKVLPVVCEDGSDSAMFDNTVEFMLMGGIPLPKVMAMMIPEPWSGHETMSEEKKAFYEFESCLMEPWDGPAAMGFTDGVRIGAVLDRNGLRPSRYWVTSDDIVVLASETGVLNIPPEKITLKERLRPGRMLLIDTEKGRIIKDEELKHNLASANPYRGWLASYMVNLDDLPEASPAIKMDLLELETLQKLFGYSYEDLRFILQPMGKDGIEPVGSMGNDTPLAVLSKKPQMLYDYFKQLFAQVTNPPIDALREAIITSTEVLLGAEGNLLEPTPEAARRLRLHAPVIDDIDFAKIVSMNDQFPNVGLPIFFDPKGGGEALEDALDELFETSEKAVRDGAEILILTDRCIDERHAPIPALLAVSGLHHHLIRAGLRTRCSIVLESGEPREMHHFATLISFGASAVYPYLACRSVKALVESRYIQGLKPDASEEEKAAAKKNAVQKYIKAANKGVIKILSKMGISTIQSYQGAQIYEALGLNSEVVDRYFTNTPSRIEGAGLDEIAKEAALRHDCAFAKRPHDPELDSGGIYQYRRNGEHHLYNPETIHALQVACRTGDYSRFKEYSKLIDSEQDIATLRGLLRFRKSSPVPIDEVESVEDICTRFKTGAMSFGSISRIAHETIAIAMNRIHGKSNTGEGGEDPARFTPDENGDSRCSAIKQVASGRFGVTGEYLANSKEIQIKMAQGAKPGEGGQLPGRKVSPYVAMVRHSTPGVGLISPPPHHDIYSIEDLKQLIHDLKCSNPDARINVKLVSEAGVGTIAAGVAKGFADVILISGYDGGTGASPRTSMRHAGLPWELGIAETHQTLLLNNLRSRVRLETDGKLMTGRDVAIACLLGAEEFGFATAPLVALGCVMMRVCNLDTCPVGIATQNPELIKKFSGKPEYVVNFMRFIAQELREIMAELGLRTVNEMVGRCDLLEFAEKPEYWKTSGIDLSAILYKPDVGPDVGTYCSRSQDHGLEKSIDERFLLEACAPAIERGEKVRASFPIKNTDRTACTILGSVLSKKYGAAGLPEGTIDLSFEGSAGQSFGAFVPKGVTMRLTGDANDYLGKGLSGGKIILKAPGNAAFTPEENIIAGNVAFYGATDGEAYIGGAAGERFCVRNSGVKAVVEAVGDHCCEYMTGGRVVVLGGTGRNFAAGMSGGIAWVYDADGTFPFRCNTEMADLEEVAPEDLDELRGMIERHLEATGSKTARHILDDWENSVEHFVKVMPRDYKRMLTAIERAHRDGLTGEEALQAAFEANNRDLSRVGGN